MKRWTRGSLGGSVCVSLLTFVAGAVPATLAAQDTLATVVLDQYRGGRGGPGIPAIIPIGGGTAAAADFNQDGHPDVAIADGITRQVSVHLGNAEAGVTSRSDVPLPAAPTLLALGDFNQDGVADLAAASPDAPNVFVLVGDGAGGFWGPIVVPAGGRPSALTVADMNRDGADDLVLLDKATNTTSVLAASGPVTFRIERRDATASGAAPDVASTAVEVMPTSDAGAPVTSLTLNPSTITGGTGGISIGTVTIGGAAPVGGQVITLASSNTDLAASTPRIVVPEGATTATFIVGTNALYRSYSGLSFNVTITASNADAASASAVLRVTAQTIPGPFTGGTNSADARATAGNICGGAFGSGNAAERGILYRCEFPGAGQFSVCRFLQECSFGCQTVSADRLNRRDVCATAPPFPIVVNPEIVEGGRRSNGTVFLSAPAAPLTNANVQSGAVGKISPAGGFDVPQGATSAPFDVDTIEVAVPAFPKTSVALSLNPQERFAHDYLAVVPAAGLPTPTGPLAPFLLDLRTLAVPPGIPSIGTVVLNGVAPSGGAVVSLSSSHPAATVPATVTVPAGQTAIGFNVSTGGVSAQTSVTIRATLGGVSASEVLVISPFVFATTQPALASLTVNPATVTGGTRSRGRVTMASPAPDPSDGAVAVELTSDRPDIAVVQRHVTVGYGTTIGDFAIITFPVAQATPVTITAARNGIVRTAVLTIEPGSGGAPPPPPPPPPPPAPVTVSALTVNPTAVVGGNASTGTVTLSAAAPAGGAAVTLTDNSSAVTVPASVTVAAGATTATFSIATTSVTASSSATITAAYGGVTRTASLNVNPPAQSQTAVLTVTATGRSGERVTSSPAGINVAVGSSGSASFTVGTSITLSVSNGRDAIWSGACSSGGNKRRSCTFTLNGNASVSANVR